MKALIRESDNDIVKETDGIVGIDWKDGYPLTDCNWCGGPYKLIENYSPLEIEPEISGDPSNI